MGATEMELREAVMLELRELDKSPELSGDTWPFHGHVDFRKFTPEDYAGFSGGLYKVEPIPILCRWIGGSARAKAAKDKLEALGYSVIVSYPTNDHDHWTFISFTPKAAQAE